MADPHNTPSEGEYQSWQDPSRPKPTKTHWVTRAGDYVAIVEMGDDHLINTIRMLRRQGLKAKSVDNAEMLRGHGSINGEGAHDALDREIQELEETSIDDYLSKKVVCYGPMIKEAARRKLVIPPVTEAEMNRAILTGARVLINLGDWEKGGK